MAKIEVNFNDELAQRFAKLEEGMEKIIPEVLEAGGQIVLARAKSNLASSIGRGLKYPNRSKGELASKLGLSPAKQGLNGDWNVRVGFAEPHSGGITNAMLGNIIEHGKSGQPAKPFMRPAASSSKVAAINAMKVKFEGLMNQT